MRYLILVYLLGIAMSTAGYAEETDRVLVPSVTRLVLLFNGLESKVDMATQQGDTDEIDRLVAPDFELRIGARPGEPTPRAVWLRQLRAKTGAVMQRQQMAVHDYENVAIVSYLCKQSDNSSSVKDISIVDVWKKRDASWQLAIRYAAPAGPADFVIPGAATQEPTLDKRF